MEAQSSKFGKRVRQLREQRQMTLRALADAAGVDFTYLSKVENGRVPYTPSVETIRVLASALGCDALELLRLADKVPPELEPMAGSAHARRFLERAQEIASPEDWEALLKVLERRQRDRRKQAEKGL